MANRLKCVHGLIWQTCNTCASKTEEEVLAELKRVQEEQHKLLEFDYQDPNEDELEEEDRDYDLEDMRMS